MLTLTEVAAAIREHKLSSVEVTRSLLARIERWQPVLNAFVRVEVEEALAAAAAADAAIASGIACGPLHGVPLAHKDMYYITGKLAECGSKIRNGWVAPATSTAIARVQDAGAVRLGALHMAEFAYGPTGHNEHLGPARNPWDPQRITGGSSSGSAASVAARLTYAALGSDTGGSIRLPAHFCGVTGFKPTYGRVSRANAMPLSFTLDTVGPLALSAEDCALIGSVIAGVDPLDPTTSGAPAWDMAATSRGLGELWRFRPLGQPGVRPGHQGTHHVCRDRDRRAGRCRAQGHGGGAGSRSHPHSTRHGDGAADCTLHRPAARPAGRRARRLPHPRHAAHLHRWPFGPATDVDSGWHRRRLPGRALPDRLGRRGRGAAQPCLRPFAVLWGRHLIGRARE
jgi:Amidase